MKLSHVVIASMVGMVGSSVGVSWALGPVQPPALVEAAVAAPPAAPDVLAIAPPTAPAVSGSSFVAEGPLRVEARAGHAVLPATAWAETFVLVEVGASSARSAGARAPVDVAIVLDRSGSMRGRRLANAVAAVRSMVAQLGPDDTVSVVAYADSASTLVAPTAVGQLDRRAMARTLERMRPRGHTCISCGIERARSLLRERDGGVERILLLSDGEANRGVVATAGLRTLADAAGRERVAIATIGVDIDYDERTMLALSEASNGRHYFVQDTAGLGRVFEQERAALAETVADRADLEIRLAQGVELVEVVDRPHELDRGRITIPLGAFAKGEQKTALLRVRVAPGSDARELAQVQLAYRDAAQRRPAVLEGNLSIERDDAKGESAVLDARVEARLGRKDTFDALIGANAAFARGDVSGAEAELDRARRRVRARKTTSGGDVQLEQDFQSQLEALGTASSGIQAAAKDVAPTVAPTRPAGKSITRKNVAAADPFSD